PLIRTEGLLAIGARSARITPSGFEQYDHLATSIASQVVGVGNRDELVPCKPASLDAPDDSCAKEFLTKAGRLLYRRPLTETEIRTYVQAAAEAASGLHSFYDGLGIALAGMLTTPQFLFVIDTTEPDPDNPGAVRL